MRIWLSLLHSRFVSSRNERTLRDDTKNGCVADYIWLSLPADVLWGLFVTHSFFPHRGEATSGCSCSKGVEHYPPDRSLSPVNNAIGFPNTHFHWIVIYLMNSAIQR